MTNIIKISRNINITKLANVLNLLEQYGGVSLSVNDFGEITLSTRDEYLSIVLRDTGGFFVGIGHRIHDCTSSSEIEDLFNKQRIEI